MHLSKFNRRELNLFDDQHLNLVYNQELYSHFINREFSIENFEAQIVEKGESFRIDQRKTLVASLSKQYDLIANKDKTSKNIMALSDAKTFTITTGHQLSLMTGPLYFVVKILHVVKLCEVLKERYKENNFVPVFWMASEDHDFEEIQNVSIFNKNISWNSTQNGPVGQFDLEGFDSFKNEIAQLFSNHPEGEIHELLRSYSGENLAEASRNLLHSMFGEYGLVIIDGSEIELKTAFKSVMSRELEEEFVFKSISKTNQVLKANGAKIQVHVREINLFYIEKGIRTRVKKEGNKFVIDGVGTFSKEKILVELEKHPEKFSPNAILRPLYQESILPNLAYIGGVGELSYWLQIKGVFDVAACVYPLIEIRNSILWIDATTSKKMEKIDMQLASLFNSADMIKREYIVENSGLDVELDKLDKLSNEMAILIEETVVKSDSNQRDYALSEVSRLKKQLEAIKNKLVKIGKEKHEQQMTTIEQIKEKLFPNAALQERSENFFSFCSDGNFKERIAELYNLVDPLEKDLIVLRET